MIGDDIFAYLQNGGLVLRGMGYFRVEIFRAIEVFGANWLSRLPLSVDVLVHQKTNQGEEVERELEQVLQQTTAKRLDVTVSISSKGHGSRLVAERFSKQHLKGLMLAGILLMAIS